MKRFPENPVFKTILALLIMTGCHLAGGVARAAGPAETKSGSPPVTIQEDASTYTLDNGIVAARVAKSSGDIVSLRYQGLEILATFLGPDGQPDLQRDPPGANPNGLNRGMTDHQYGFWSHDAMGPRGTDPAVARITIDPKSNGGERAEVSIKGISNGRRMGTGPGASPQGNFISDIEIRYALGRGDSGVYTYCTFEHKPEYAASSIGEARFCAKLNDYFDWMSISANRDMRYPKDLHEGDKYIYTAVQYNSTAFGWSSTTKKVGFFLINPTVEYLSGGPTKVEFLGHRDTNPVAAPCVLNYWRSSHYGGALVNVAQGEHWTKVVGPFFLYVNSGANPKAMYQVAQAQAKKENQKWPYDWVSGVDYPHANERATVKGQLVLKDPLMPRARMSHVMVGLTAPAYAIPVTGPGGTNATRQVDWQIDAKHYEFWVHGEDSGRFEIPKVRPGTYTLHALADGVLGEFAKTDVTVDPGNTLDLGKLTWTPVRHGRQLWDVGIPNRNGSEFFKGDEFADPEISLKYATLFSNDVNYVIGKSDFRKDWFFQQVPHNEDPNAKAEPYFGVRGNGRATPFAVTFNLSNAPRGKATLRLAICGTGARTIEVTVNDKPAGRVDRLIGDGAITRHSIQGIWYERELAFDASLMKQGTNVLKLTVPAGPVNNGIIYDYIRLELDESAAPPITAAALR
jgi:rhamnogalacturonan endolyase